MPSRNGVLILVAMLALSAPSHGQTQPSDTISSDQLIGAAEQVRSFVPRDQFDSPPAGPAWNGRQFSYTVVPVGSGTGTLTCTGLPRWVYQNAQLWLDATPEVVSPFALSGQLQGSAPQDLSQNSELNLYSITCQQSAVEMVDATNALGVHFPVERWTDSAIGIFDTSAFDRKWTTTWRTDIQGDAARDLSRDLRVEVSGTLHAWPSGRMIVCVQDDSTPTITRRMARTRNICAYNGKLERIAFIRASTGQVLYEILRKR